MFDLREPCCANCRHWRPYRGLITAALPFGECAMAVADPAHQRVSTCCDDTCWQHAPKFLTRDARVPPVLITRSAE